MTLIDQIGSQAVRRVVQFRACRGASLLGAIEEAVHAEGIRAGVIVSGLGALEKAVFRNLRHFPRQFPVTPEDRLYLEITSPMELVSLTGWIAPQAGGGTGIHAHFAASLVQGDTVATLGGHLTPETLCGIKVVAAILEVAPEGVAAREDPDTRTADLFLLRDV
jgi:predicted DNA-binding protein with PD1-like motif